MKFPQKFAVLLRCLLERKSLLPVHLLVQIKGLLGAGLEPLNHRVCGVLLLRVLAEVLVDLVVRPAFQPDKGQLRHIPAQLPGQQVLVGADLPAHGRLTRTHILEDKALPLVAEALPPGGHPLLDILDRGERMALRQRLTELCGEKGCRLTGHDLDAILQEASHLHDAHPRQTVGSRNHDALLRMLKHPGVGVVTVQLAELEVLGNQCLHEQRPKGATAVEGVLGIHARPGSKAPDIHVRVPVHVQHHTVQELLGDKGTRPIDRTLQATGRSGAHGAISAGVPDHATEVGHVEQSHVADTLLVVDDHHRVRRARAIVTHNQAAALLRREEGEQSLGSRVGGNQIRVGIVLHARRHSS